MHTHFLYCCCYAHAPTHGTTICRLSDAQCFSQRDDGLHLSTRVQRFADPRRRITALEIKDVMRDWDHRDTRDERAPQLDVLKRHGAFNGQSLDSVGSMASALVMRGGAEGGGPRRGISEEGKPGEPFDPEYVTGESVNRKWGSSHLLDPRVRHMEPVRYFVLRSSR